MRKVLVLLFATISTLTFGVPRFDVKMLESDTIYSLADVDVEPTLERGMESLYRKWNSLAKYPAQARRKNIQGKLFLSFIIDEKGDITEPKVEKGLGYGCDESAIDALLKTGLKWIPGTKNGKKVKVRLFLPFVFRID